MKKTRFLVLLGVMVLSLSFVSIVLAGASAAQNTVNANASPDFEVNVYDWGDAPDPSYPVLRSNNGAYHIIDGNIYLGSTVDADSDGQPDPNAMGDDADGLDDEDGVTFTSPLFPADHAEVTVEVSGEGHLNAWMDFNMDGDWDDGGEHIIDNFPALPGVHQVPFVIPGYALVGETYARFRLSLGPIFEPYGFGDVGEVEDYLVEILDDSNNVSIIGYKWNDLNADGIKQNEEDYLSGWAIQANSGDIFTHTVTDETGFYAFYDLPPGTYTITEELRPGWEQTYPPSGYYKVTIPPGESSSGNMFGNRESPAIWEKFLYDHPWESPGVTLTFEVSSYIDVEEYIYLTDPDASFTLTEEWNPAHLELVEWNFNFGEPVIDHENGVMQWIVPPGHPDMLMVIKLFHVLPCDWEITTISETLEGVTVDDPQRNFYIEKPNGVIFIDGTYEPEVPSGEYAQYTMAYGSTDFSESDVTIHTEYPPEAPFANAYVFPDRWDETAGSWAEWDIGLVSPANEGEIDVSVFIQPEMPVSTTVDIRNEIWDHLDRVLDVFTVTYHITEPVRPSWEKWVDGEPWQPGIELTLETSDTVTVVDVIEAPSEQSFTLFEEWVPGELHLEEYNVKADIGEVFINEASFVWEVPPEHPGTVVITKTFHIEPCNWQSTVLHETLIGLEVAYPERQVILNKRVHDLHLSEVHHPETYPGDSTGFTLSYLNDGGYENDVMIVSQFPMEAQFLSSVPEPSYVDPNIVVWELGDLSSGSEGTIDVQVEIFGEAEPSSTITITNAIIDHTGGDVENVEVVYHVNEFNGYSWEKWINGQPWTPGIAVQTETSDTIVIEEVIYRDEGFPIEFNLIEQYFLEELQLLGWVETWGEVYTETLHGFEYLTWVIPPEGPTIITLTLWLHVEPSTWTVTYLNDELTSDPYFEVRGLTVQKIPPDLWIDSLYIQDVLPGEYVDFILQYGNDGGYENSVAIVNQFPPEAPFISSDPPPTAVDPPYVLWEVGDLGTDTGGTITVTVQIAEEVQVSTTIEIVDWIYNHVIQAVDVATTTYHVAEEGERLFDLGDAPDSTNHAGALMRAYHFPPAPPIMAHYPTVFDPATGLPSGPLHLNPRGDAWLGEWVTLEAEADLPPDEDGATNIDPSLDVPDLDIADDGLLFPLSLPDCIPTVLTYTVNVPPWASPVDRFVNVWIDWNRDGDWGDTFSCEQGDASEWAVQNLLLPPLPPGFHPLQTPAFLPSNKAPGLPTWLRITLATQPAPFGPDGSPPDGHGPGNGYLFGETEDYLIPGVEPNIPGWEKWIEFEGERIPWEPELVLSLETSDTITVVDVFHGGGAFTLVESWNPAHLGLMEWSADPEGGVVIDPAGSFLYWVVNPEHPETITMTKSFHVRESTWMETWMDERLLINMEVMDYRPVPILKRPPILWINSSYEREVQAGNVIPFWLQFGNEGGFENNVTIRNEFPPEAPFIDTIPPPTRWDPAGLWAEWDLEGLDTGASGQIEVLVQIMPGLQPSTTIEIWDWIFNHVDEPLDEVVTIFHVGYPPVGSIFGHKWFDVNDDGIRDPEEPGLPDWQIVALRENGTEESTSTDENGNYHFIDLPVGSYTVTEEIKEGWTQSYPPEGYHVVNLNPGQHVQDMDFGNYQPLVGWVDGHVYDAELVGNQPTCNPAQVLVIPGGHLIPVDPGSGAYGPEPLLEDTYTLIANANGYGPENALVDILRGMTTTQDFNLTRPAIEITPNTDPVTVTLEVGETFTHSLNILNNGHMPLQFEMVELGGMDIPWVSEDPISGTIPSPGSQQVDVILTCSEPGIFRGALGVQHNDPCEPIIEIPLELNCREPPPLTWVKWVDGIAWTPGLTLSRQTSDTIVAVDTLSGPGPFTLVENWDGTALDLSGWEQEPEGIGVVDEAGPSLYWVVPEDRPETVTITKTFHVEPSTWVSTTLTEVVWIDQEPVMEREVTIFKVPPRLWIDSEHPTSVKAGETVTFTLRYGNDGGYENNVTIRNDFPASAPFLFAVPFPDRVGQDGTWVEWDLGDLEMNSMEAIEVEAAVLSGIQPSTTIQITDVIFNHIGEEIDRTTISLHVDDSIQGDDDIYMKDNPLDDGSVPSSAPWWESVDLWVRTDGDCSNTAHQNPVGGQINTVCARVRNRMATTVNNLDVAVYFANAALGMSWPTSWTPVGSAHITSLAGYAETVVAIPWSTPYTTGHFCMLARVNTLEDPVGVGPDTMVPADLPQNNNNITMRNMEIVRFPEITNCSQITTGLYTDVVTLDVVNTIGEPVLVDILLESDDYPLDSGELLLNPGDLWGNWEALSNFDQLGMDLVVTDFPASIQGITLIPYQRSPITITMTADVGVRFTLRVSEAVESQVVGGVTYVREVPHCVYLPLIMRSSPPGGISALEHLWDGWAGWRSYHNGFRWLGVLHRAGYYPQFKPGS